MEDIFVRYYSLPIHIGAMTIKDGNDDYNIYINCKLSETEQIYALTHELIHIREGDFFSDKSVMEIEAKCEEEMERYK